MNKINSNEVEEAYNQLKKNAESSGYFLNPDVKFTKELIKNLLVNQQRYGYWACPCRLSSGKKEKDLDIICPCEYRDPDLNEFDTCYCALYVSKDVIDGKKEIGPIPDRRPLDADERKIKKNNEKISKLSISKPVWRCKVCGYLCGRDEPPELCPICKAKKERFERFL